MSFLRLIVFVAFVVTKCMAGFLPAHGHPLTVGAHCAKSDECIGVAICGTEQICECPAPLYKAIGGECQLFNAWGTVDFLSAVKPLPALPALPAAPIPAPVALPKIVPRAPFPAFNRFFGGPAFAPAPVPHPFPGFAAPYLQHNFAATRFGFPFANGLAPAPLPAVAPAFAPAPLPAFAPAPLPAFAPAPVPAFAPAPLPAFAPAPLPAVAPAPLPAVPAPAFPAPAFPATGCAAGLVLKAGICAPVVIPVDQSLPGEPCNAGQECTGGSVCTSGGLCVCPPELVHIGDSCVLPPPPPPPAAAALVGPAPVIAAPAPVVAPAVAPAPLLAPPAPIFSAPAPFAPAIAPAIAPAVIKTPLHYGVVAVGNPCVATAQCVAGAQCSLGACHCGAGYFASGTSCLKKL